MSLMFNEFSFRYLIKKHGLEIKKIIYPYLEDAYSNLEKDYKNVKDIIMGKSTKSNPFWGSIMTIVIKI